MSSEIVLRPIWRRFRPRYLRLAAAHVRRGGHAAIVPKHGPIDVLLTVDNTGKITELGLWALLAIEQKRYRKVKDGPAKGLAIARIQPDYEGSVLDFCDRDSVHAG